LLKRVEPWGFLYSLDYEPGFTWAEIGDPPLTRLAPKGQRPVSPHLRAPFPERRKVYPSGPILRWQEIELLRLWHEDYAESALNALCEVHRPMVVSMAQKYVGANRKLLIEYGMFGLRFAANRQRVNRKKKGSMAGYDPGKGRFSTYARHHAARLMRDAARGHRYQPPQYLQDKVTEFREWAATPFPLRSERDCANRPDGGKSEIEELFPELGARVFRWEEVQAESGLPRHRSTPGRWPDGDHQYEYGKTDPHCFCISATPFGYLVCWIEGYFVYPFRFTKEAKKRNYLTRPVTELERENRRKYYEKYGYKLGTFDNVAKDGLSAWEGDGDDANAPEDAAAGYSLFGVYNGETWWEPCTGAFQKDKYELPKEVLLQRWRLAHRVVSFVEQPGARLTLMVGERVVRVTGFAPVVTRVKPRLPYSTNDGLGLYDRRGHRLPQFSLSVDKFIPKKRGNAPEVCLDPLSGIFLVRKEEIPVSWRRLSPHQRRLRHPADRCLPRATKHEIARPPRCFTPLPRSLCGAVQLDGEPTCLRPAASVVTLGMWAKAGWRVVQRRR
jgi:hypothetical protein